VENETLGAEIVAAARLVVEITAATNGLVYQEIPT
jgi:hypothetical protein